MKFPAFIPAVIIFTSIIPTVLFAGEVSFNRDIRPLLADRCFSCHGPDSATRKADLRLDLEEAAKAPLGKEGQIPIHPGKPEQSTILHRLTHADPDELMPPPESKITVSPEEIALLRKWIREGAKWERHWAFIPPVKSTPPAKPTKWARNEIDHFIAARLDAEGLKPSPPADPAHLIRRLSFDLTGLPPTIAELDAFLDDPSDAAYEKVVDRLLNAPAYGERMALEWLDIARYGDTDGLFEDHPRSIYPWRDWLVRAFNQNLSYRDFISWQVAGDLMPDATVDQKLATGFLRNNPTSNEGGIIDEDYRVKYVIDRVNTTAMAFLGVTLECAQCHDHKFDPMTQREYYEFSGFFNSMTGKGNTKGSTAPVLKSQTPEDQTRLLVIDSEIKAIDQTLKEDSPALLSDFETWQKELAQPIAWQAPTILAHSGEEKAATTTSAPSEIKGRFVRLAHAPGHQGFLTISEVEIYTGGQNIAPAGKATQSSVGYKSPAAKAIDGQNNGSFASCSCTNEEKAPWWEVDLGAMEAIDHILVFNRNDCCPERLDKVQVQVLDEARKVVSEYSTADAPYRSVFTLNPKAPEPVSKQSEYSITLTQAEAIAALQFSAETSGLVNSLRVEVVGKGKPRAVKTTGPAKFKVGKDQPGIIGLASPITLAKGEQLKLSVQGGVVQVATSSSPAAGEQATVPEDPKKRLEHFKKNWSGFAEIRTKREALAKEKTALDKRAVISMVAADDAKKRPTYMLARGEYDKRGEEVQPAAPGSIMPYADSLPRNRSGLAQWMVDPQNPLTARVAVNRYWQMIFGRGIVKTSEDFGTQGDRPSHAALLDTLAVDFVASNWDVKRLLRKMVTSSTYRQASRQSPDMTERDPDNMLLARVTRQRLPAEFLRDHALASSGLLVKKLGGPGVQPYQPAVLFGANAIGSSRASFKLGTGDALYRRSLYTYWKRQIPAANMRILGADGRTACRSRREVTNTPLQALVVLNDPQFVEAARMLAARVMTEGGETPQQRIAYAFRLATSRQVTAAELELLSAEFDDRLREFTADPKAATDYLNGGGQRKADTTLKPSELAAYAAVASLILNLDESLSKS